MDLQAVFFDFDGTLRHSDPPSVEVFHDIAAELGVPATMETRREAERWVYAYWASSDDLLLDLERYGAWDGNGAFWENHARRHLSALGAGESQAAALAARITEEMLARYSPEDCVPADVLPTLAELRSRGIRIGVVSNRSKPFGEDVERLGLSPHVELVLAAGEVDLWKPDPRILLHAVEQMDLRPEQAAYVGDNYYADVVSAAEAGLLPVLFDPKGLFQELETWAIASMSELLTLLDSLLPAQAQAPHTQT
jgi:HAD superfamily hydrolase (TIGR01549 family)